MLIKKIITRKYFTDENVFNLVTRKGIFPYDYVDDWKKLDDAQLPLQSCFDSQLNNQKCNDENYQHACNYGTRSEFKLWGSTPICI